MRLRVFGVEVSISFWFFALILCFALLDRQNLLFYFALPMAVHELGHLIVLALWGAPVREVRFSALGVAILRGRGAELSYAREIAVCLAGASANLLMALALYLFCFQSMRVMFLIAANLAVALFNLAPVGELDGGQALRLIAERNLPPRTARGVSRGCSLLVLGLLFGLTIFLLMNRWYNPTLPVACAYLAFHLFTRE